MNRYFIPGEGRRDFPRRSYAKLDQIEPPNLEGAKDILFAFDAIDTEWLGFREELLSLESRSDTKAVLQRIASSVMREIGGSDPFDDLPIYRIEITLKRQNLLAKKFLDAGDVWFEIELDPQGELEVDVFGGLFMEPVPARLAHLPRPAAPSAMLTCLFGMDDWPDASEEDLVSALKVGCRMEHLVMFDVGQGSATALICGCGQPVIYFDVGCGVYRNAKTRPNQISFCTHEPPLVILSHWDADHWAAATLDRRLLGMTWIAPRQSISQTHKVFGNEILKAGGRILIVPPTLSPLLWNEIDQGLELRRCTGNDRNGSGLALVVEDHFSQRGWLLTGDAAYNLVPGLLPGDLAAVVVPHHGADMGPASIPPSVGSGYTRLLYSFGPDNAHGRTSVRHPTAAAVRAHEAAGWSRGAWVLSTPAMNLAGQPVLATASHLSTHEQGIVVGWTGSSSPGLLNHAASCPDVMPVVQK
ncbi:hypothetical protein [Brucella cytisi]|uniref:Metallo-beta-lactamase domain-containing protein n=1 Tax=Brucella cytisi TaxID=407152 RepID=A0A1J6HC17_9HYPH|nr:hypothetical protein [Brucella cytisi]OIS90684.1 hypothetical protein BLA27_25470 [Brucella cytisi]